MNRVLAWALGLGVAPAVALVVAACGEKDIVVAYIDAGSAGGLDVRTCGGDAGTCEAGLFCLKPPAAGCGEATGTCAALPDAASCAALPFNPVCGCDDNVTYYNDCLRQVAGQPAMIQDVCSKPAPCVPGGTPCASGSTCTAYVFPAVNETVYSLLVASALSNPAVMSGCQMLQAAPPFPGMCWKFPDTCPADGGKLRDLCAPESCVTVDACNGRFRDGGGFYGQWGCP